MRLLCVNTGGVGDLHGLRMRRLASPLTERGWDVQFYDLEKADRKSAARDLWNRVTGEPWDLVYQESTGIASGMTLVRAARARGLRYVVSSGDPVSGFFRVTRGAGWGAAFGVYEKLLYRHSAGFIGWTPYLTGRAIELGAPRGVTVEGAVALDVFKPLSPPEKQEARARVGIPADHLVLGVVGSLKWVERQAYCYGLELVEVLRRLRRTDVSLLIVGDGDGRARLEARVPEALRSRAVFTGRVPEADVATLMNVMDIGFITQTLDDLGSYRLTTKMPEYLACGLPVAMSPTPGYFDYVGDAGWALPARHPSSEDFWNETARWVDALNGAEIEQRAGRCRAIAEQRFAYPIVGARFENFLLSLADERGASLAASGHQTAPARTEARETTV